MEMMTQPVVPQADDLDKVFAVAEYVAEGVSNSKDLAERLDSGLSERQGFYYAAAAASLGIVTHDAKTRALALTKTGKVYLMAEGETKRLLRQKIVMQSPVIRYLAGVLGIKSPRASQSHLFEDTTFVADNIKVFGLANETAYRRAGTIASWMRNL